MPSRNLTLSVSCLTAWLVVACAVPALAEPPSDTRHGVTPDDEMTLVVGTRFVAPAAADQTAKSLFVDERIPLEAFNETDHCVDQSALEAAQDYFTNLGRVLGKASHFYFVPDAEIKRAVSMCERLHGRPPKAWVDTKTKVIAFGRVVPAAYAPALENSIR